MHPQGSCADPLRKSNEKQGPHCGRPGDHLSERGKVGTQRTSSLTPATTQKDEDVGYHKYTDHQIVILYLSYLHFQQ